MPRPRKDSRKVFTLTEFKDSHRLDRIKIHMMEPERFPLSDSDEEYHQQLLQVYQNCFEEMRQGAAVTWIQENIPGCESKYKSNRLLSDCYEVFAPFVQKNKELRRHILVEKLYWLAERAMQDDDYALAADILAKAGKFEGLDKVDEVQFDPEAVIIPQITISADATLLLPEKTENDEPEDAEYTEE